MDYHYYSPAHGLLLHHLPHTLNAVAKMDVQDVQQYLTTLVRSTSEQFHKIPGSAIFLRYVKSSYQNDPIRSAVELFLVLFAIRYLLAPKYSTKPNYVKLSDEVSEAVAPAGGR